MQKYSLLEPSSSHTTLAPSMKSDSARESYAHCASFAAGIANLLPSHSVSARRYWLSLIALMLIMLFMGYQCRLSTSPDITLYYSFLKDVGNEDMCTIPKNDPWDASIKKYLSRAEPLSCRQLQNELTYLANGQILFNQSELDQSGYTLTSISCRFRCFDRKNGDDVTLVDGEWEDLKNGSQVKCEFTEVDCRKSFPPVSVYVNLHSHIRQKAPAESVSPADKKPKGRQPNVVLFVVDSVSHSNWIRNLPKTLSVLQDDYNSFVFDGFTKVGDNSFPNAAAFLTGKRVLTVGYKDELPGDMSNDFFDEWPIIWKDFKRSGYMTYYAEDYPQFNLFKYLSNGFKQQPTDHYFRPFWLKLYNSFLHRRSTHLCYGNNPCHRLQLDYLSDFIFTYHNHTPTFSFNWLTELGHDWLNQVSMGDDDISEFFKRQKEQLKDSFVFVFSDHGHRFDPIRQSLLGRIEERMPFFSMHTPEWLLAENPKLKDTINSNTKQLTSFWDLYITLRDILDMQAEDTWSQLNDATEQPEEHFRQYSPRGLSLLRPLPTRNCESTGIPEDFCICQREQSVNVSDPRVITAAESLMEHVNTLLSDHSESCVPLKLRTIQNAQVSLPNVNVATSKEAGGLIFGGAFASSKSKVGPAGFYINYRVTVEALPSGALFDATIRNHIADDTFEVVGDVNRINKYGNQSLCVNSPLLRKYCYCASQEGKALNG